MDSMTLKQTMDFLLVPEATLSMVFLVIFAVLFAFGIWLYVKCIGELKELKANAEALYEPVSNKLSPENFLRSALDKISASEGIMEGIPDAFVSIGILATFIGLGVAIQSAADLLSTDTVEIERLIDLLGIIAFKFQTSVWGILFSLIFRRFIVERYFSYRQEIIDEVRERLYEKERDGIRTLLEKQNRFLENQLEYQKATDDARHAQTERLLANQLETLGELRYIREHMAEYVQASLEFTAAAKLFTQQAALFTGYVNDYRAEVENFKATMKDTLDSSSQRLTATLEEIGNQQFETLCQMKSGIEDMQRIFLRDEDRFVEEIRRKLSTMLGDTGQTFKDTLNQTIDKVSGDYNSVLESFNEKFDANLKNLSAEYTKEIHHFGAAANNVSKVLAGIEANVQNLHGVLVNEQRAILASNNDSYVKVESVLNNFEGTLQQVLKNLTDVYAATDGLVKHLQEVNDKALAQQNENLRQFTNSFISSVNVMQENQRRGIEERTARIDATVTSIDGIAKRVAGVAERTASVAETQSGTADIIVNVMGENNSLLKDIARGQTGIIGELQSTREGIEKLPALQDFTQALSKTLAEQLAQLKEISAPKVEPPPSTTPALPALPPSRINTVRPDRKRR